MRLLSSILIGMCCVFAHAQSPMFLKDYISMGIENNLSLKSVNVERDKAHLALSQNRAKLLPEINGILQFTDYLMSPVNVTTGVALGGDFPDNPSWQTIKSMKYNASAGILLQMPIYNRTIFATIDVAKTIEELKNLSYEKAKDDLITQISKVYYLAQASQELVRLLDENVERMKQLCEITKALYEQGGVLEVDVTRVEINIKDIETHRSYYSTLFNQQLNMLRYLLDVDKNVPLSIASIDKEFKVIPTDGVSPQLPELQLANQQINVINQQIKTVKAQYLPSVSLSGYVGALGYQDKFHNFFNSPSTGSNWFGNSYIGISVKVPLFDARSKHFQIEQYKHDVSKAKLNLELSQNRLNEDYANSSLQLKQNIENYHIQADNYRQAKTVLELSEEQYKEGVASMTTVLQDEMRMRNAQAACVQALCECNISQVGLLKLAGDLMMLTE